MKVLHLTNKPIFPTLDGGRLAMFKMLQNLLDLGYEVKNLTISTNKHPYLPETFPEKLLQIIRPESVHVQTEINYWQIFKSLFSRKSYQVVRFYNKEFEQLIVSHLKKDDYGLIIIESAFLLTYLPLIREFTDAKIVVRTHNVEYRLWRQAVKREKSMIKRMYFRKLANTMKRFELTFLNKSDGIMSISEQDHDFFKRRGIKVPITVIPVHMEANTKWKPNYEIQDFFFVGSMNWRPNQEALRWITRRLAPQLYKEFPEVKIHIAGSNMTKSMKEIKSKNVVIHGRVPDILEFMSQHGTMIVPLKSGSGVRIKILEALSIGTPIISTDKGKEGIGIQTKIHYLSANVSEEFITQMKFICEHPEQREAIGTRGKAFVYEEYSLKSVSLKIREFIQKIS